MQLIRGHLILLLKRLLILFAVYSLCRLLFYLFNFSYFSGLSLLSVIHVFIVGLKFDASAIILSNSLYLLLFLLPVSHFAYQKVLHWLFYIVNSFAIALNCLDLAYFRFTLKRSMADIFSFFRMGDDLEQLFPVFLKQYWYIFIIAILTSFLMIRMYNRTISTKPELTFYTKDYLKYSIAAFLCFGIFILVSRGGTDLKPINIITAAKYVEPHYMPLVLNTPFTVLKSLEQKGTEPLNYLPEKEALKIYSPIHPAYKGDFKKQNVVIIILESFSFEYIGSLTNSRGHTPFLDSLIAKSFVCSNAYANAKRSIEALPAILAGLPNLMEEPYITSAYGSNQLSAMATALKQKGYKTSFYHGATNGTMSFDSFTSLAGFDNYYGRKEYNNDKDFDGNWGIWDEPYLQYFSNELGKTKEPFLSAVFTLSSHHPFNLPEKYKNAFPEGDLEIHRTIGYTDMALRKFFDSAKKQKWFNNTLFVITADHTGLSKDPFYSANIGIFKIPVLFYSPELPVKKSASIFQQSDIMPSVLDFLNYPDNNFSFGTSAFDSTANHCAVTNNNNIYQLLNDSLLLQFNGEKSIGLYKYKSDSLLKNNLEQKLPEVKKKMEIYLKAYLQAFNHHLINNKMGMK
jgi:phosphoglycerol transferase MdoB-like AlkP superfamily enzyme